MFRPHYSPNTVIARSRVNEQLAIIAAAGGAEDGFRKEHGGHGDVAAAVIRPVRLVGHRGRQLRGSVHRAPVRVD